MWHFTSGGQNVLWTLLHISGEGVGTPTPHAIRFYNRKIEIYYYIYAPGLDGVEELSYLGSVGTTGDTEQDVKVNWNQNIFQRGG